MNDIDNPHSGYHARPYTTRNEALGRQVSSAENSSSAENRGTAHAGDNPTAARRAPDVTSSIETLPGRDDLTTRIQRALMWAVNAPSWVKWSMAVIAVLLGGVFLLMVLQKERAVTPNPTQARSAAESTKASRQGARATGASELERMLAALHAGRPNEAQRRLAHFIRALPADTARRALSRFLDARQGTLPGDYAFFFEETLASALPADSSKARPRNSPPQAHQPGELSDSGRSRATVPRDLGMLFYLTSDSKYTAQLVFNTEQAAGFPNRVSPAPSYRHRLVVTGGYTSPFGWPAGLAVDSGRVVNGALQSWDGLVVIDASGQVHLLDLGALVVELRHYNPRERLADYRAFLDLVRRRGWSLVQSHLLLYGGSLRVSRTPGAARARRRALFVTAGGARGIYDTLDETLTLYAFAERLRNRFDATAAINLDTGTYTYGVRYRPGLPPQHFSTLGKGVRLSNVLTVDY